MSRITERVVAERGQLLTQAFTPTSPIRLPELLRGRGNVLRDVLDAARTEAMHIVLYGDRGVGKTSLAYVAGALLQRPPSTQQSPQLGVLFASCSSSDDYSTLWRAVFSDVITAERTRAMGFTGDDATVGTGNLQIPLESLRTPAQVHQIARSLAGPLLIIIDEFDRLPGEETRTLMADTIKLFADRATNATIMIVGVADSVAELLQAHQSIGRNLQEIHVPLMSENELREIVEKGWTAARMTWAEGVSRKVARLARGYPNYAHMLARETGRAALNRQDDGILDLDVQEAINGMVEGPALGLRTDYERGVDSPQPENLFRQVLLACALAEKDALGRFAAADVRAPLRAITGRNYYDIPHFQSHLTKFCQSPRNILKQSGAPRSYRYRFVDPRMIPYVILKGAADNLTTLEQALR